MHTHTPRILANIQSSIFSTMIRHNIPNLAREFNKEYSDYVKNHNILNYKYIYIPESNNKIISTLQFTCNKESNLAYTSITDYKDKGTNTYLYEIIRIYDKKNNLFDIEGQFIIGITDKTNISIVNVNYENMVYQLHQYYKMNHAIISNSTYDAYTKISKNIFKK